MRLLLALMFATVLGCPPPRPIPAPSIRPLQGNLLLRPDSGPALRPVPTPDAWRDSRLPAMPPVNIVIDPGHGGHDPGTLGRGNVAPEKEVALAIGREVARLLRGCGARVFMTREDDTYVSLDDRAALADALQADLLVSIHADAAENTEAEGATFYVARQCLPASEAAAQRIAASFVEGAVPTRGVRRADYRVLVGHRRPAVLVEGGYMTHSLEGARLSTPNYQQRIAWLIARGVV